MGLLIKIPFMDNIVHLFQSERDEIQAKKAWLVLVHSTSPAPTLQNVMRSQLTRGLSWSKAERWPRLLNSQNASIFTVVN